MHNDLIKDRLPERVKEVTDKLKMYIMGEQYRGYDPYDGLMTPVMRLPLIRSSKIIKLGTQQVIRRLPIDIRRILKIKKGINPVTLGLSVQAFTYLCNVYPDKKAEYIESIEKLKYQLTELKSSGFSGYCWGYDFDWEARYASIGAFKPTVVATGMITNGLYKYYKYSGDETIYKICSSAGDFVLKDLNRIYEKDKFCFSYSPFDKQIVFNATMKAARILAQAGKQIDKAKKTVEFVMENQNEDGSWAYSKGDSREWVDNFHTGYILDCLKEYMDLTKDESIKSGLEKGVRYYVNNFFYDNMIPKYYSNSLYPIDSTSVAQSILTLCRFGYLDLAENVVEWTFENMYSGKGYFYYQKHKYYTNKISYMRWSNAWMFLALSYFLYRKQNDLV
jgi:hypothetical protein